MQKVLVLSWGKIIVVFVVGGLTTNILPTNEATTIQAATRNVSILLNHEYFVP